MSNFNQYDNIEGSAAVLYAGDTFSFYANLDELEDDANFGNWTLNIAHDDYNLAFSSVGTLVKDIISGSDYRFYSTFTVPAAITTGCYYLIIIDDSNNVKYISNLIQAKELTDYTQRIRYRNNKDILNYNYEGLPSFYNQFRIQLVIRQPLTPTTQTGYDLIKGNFNPVRAVLGVSKEFVTLWYRGEDHEAFNASIIHRGFQVAEDGNWETYRREESEYSQEWNENYPQAEGIVRLQRTGTFKSSKLV